MGTSDAVLRERYRKALTANHPTDCDALRRLVLLDGMPSDANNMRTDLFGRCSLRGLVWKALLGIGSVDADEYASLVRQGPSVEDSRIREDAPRTFSKNADFVSRVPTDKLIRLLNAYILSTASNKRGAYAQSMSLLAAPFLYVMPEPDAFHCFRVFLQRSIPAYVHRYSGARRGCELLDRCLLATHPNLHAVLARHGLNSEVYAFPVVSSLGACVPPLADTVRLWDIQLAFGAHLHILFILARLLLASASILEQAERSSAAPLSTRELEHGFGLDAETVLAKAVPLSRLLDAELYAQLALHTDLPPSSRESTTSSDLHTSLDRRMLERLQTLKTFGESQPLTSPSPPSLPLPISSPADTDGESTKPIYSGGDTHRTSKRNG